MKVLITTDWYKPVINGVVTSVSNLYAGLSALGHDVKILTLSGNHHSYRDGYITYIGSVSAAKIYPNARLRVMPGRELIDDLVAWHPDIVHSQCEFSSFILAKQITSACHVPLVHTYHTVYEDFTHYFSPNLRLGKYMAKELSQKILKRTQAVIVPTVKISDMLKRYGVKTPINVVPTGLELTQFEHRIDGDERREMRARLGIAEDEKILIYLGRIAKEKNIDEIVTMLSHLDENAPRLLLVGDGPYRQVLEGKIKALQLEERVIFAGMVPPNETGRYYQLGDIFVSASQSETQGLTYIEAMASALPLLCRDDPCLNDVIQPGVNGFTYQREEEFRARLNDLLIDDAYRLSLAASAKEIAFSRFSSKVFAEDVLSVYESVLCNHSI